MMKGILQHFNNKILIIGFGGVAQSLLPMILKHIAVPTTNISIIDKDDNSVLFDSKYKGLGISYKVNEVTKDNIHSVLSSYVSSGDLIINLSLNIEAVDIVKWCLTNSVMYTDTSLERWPGEYKNTLNEQTLYYAHYQIRKETESYTNGATALVTNGANPGLITQFVKAGLLDLARTLAIEHKVPTTRQEWAELLKLTGTKVIHISERDANKISQPVPTDIFFNTWSCHGFWDEGNGPAEFGCGTHEHMHSDWNTYNYGSQKAVYLNTSGIDTLCKSWVPSHGEYTGMVIQHSEAITLCEYFSTDNYRPSVYYVYKPCDAAIESISNHKGKHIQQAKILKDEITSGYNELGVLFLGHDLTSWWYGSQLSIQEARKLIPGEAPTTIQVAVSVLAGVIWMIDNPQCGYIEPEVLPFDLILDICKPYLGTIVSTQSEWHSNNFQFPL